MKERSMIFTKVKYIETKRLLLRPWKEEDLEDFYAYARDEEVGPRAGWPAHQSREETKTVLDHFIKSDTVFAMEEKASGKVIGSFGFHQVLPSLKKFFSSYQGWEIGFVLNKDYWNQGLMSEAVEAVIDKFFTCYGIDFFVCGHFEGNEASRRVIEKSGFNYIANVNYKGQTGIDYNTAMYYQWNPKKEDPLKDHIKEFFKRN